MARLNDPPAPPTESVDALKRRFIRQNREIARVNSTQSQRIRNLEIEISRLLAENISLREQAINAAAEAERWRASSRLGKDVSELKSRLESKLCEVTALVEELGGLPEKAARRGSVKRRRSGLPQSLVTSPDQRDWRNRQTIVGVINGEQEGQEGRLPAILEDKYYPRRTFENEELRILTAVASGETEDTESPDLGPPPVAHFDVVDPIAFDSAKSPKRLSGGMVSSESDAALVVKNVENRRKRRTSSLLQDMSSLQHEAAEQAQNDDEASTQTKSNVKRKFEVAEMEAITSNVIQNDGFEYSRRDLTTNARPKPSRFAPRSTDRVHTDPIEEQQLSPQKSTQPRQILASKSTNSPTKKSIGDTSDKADVSKDDGSYRVRTTARRGGIPERSRITRIEPPQEDEQNQHSALAPKTPGPSLQDAISPPSSAMDTVPKTTSMEAAITNTVEDVLNGSIGRGTRRVRAAVSYAEPNLRDKMRRPDKKLVGAVEGIAKPANASDRESGRESTREQSNDPAQSASTTRMIRIKSEKNGDDAEERWKNLPEEGSKEAPLSPLQNKQKPFTSTMSDMRRKRTFSESEGVKSRVNTSLHTNDDLDHAVSRLSIFDPPLSSPIQAKTKDEDEDNNIIRPSQLPKPIPPVTTTTNTTRKPIDRPSSAAAAVAAAPSATTTKSRRHSVQPSQHPIEATGKENIPLPSTASLKLKRSSSVQVMNTTQTAGQKSLSNVSGTAVPERTLGSRRRSMMV